MTIEAVVTGAFQGREALGGFFVQEEPGDADDDPASPEALFVPEDPLSPAAVAGQIVRLQGTPALDQGLLKLTALTNATSCPGTATIAPLAVRLPFTAATQLAGTLVTFSQPLTVIDNAELGSHGRLLLAPDWQPYPTAILPPGPEAAALAAAQEAQRLRLDDGRAAAYPSPVPYLDTAGTVRAGTAVTQVTGVLSPTLGGGFTLQPVQPVALDYRNERDLPPTAAAGDLRIALVDGGGYAYGSSALLEKERQRNKLLSALDALDAGIFALTDLGSDKNTLVDLVQGLNETAVYPAVYAAIYAPGEPATTNGPALIYRVDRVAPTGPARQLDLPAFAGSPPPLLQVFQTMDTRRELVLMVPQLARRTDCPAAGPDADQGDGQGCSSARRLAQARDLAAWAAENAPAGAGKALLVIGDLQAYAQEDALRLMGEEPLLSLDDRYLAPEAYDTVASGRAARSAHAFATEPLAAQISQVLLWHHNAAEPQALDYRRANQAELYQLGPYRAAARDTLLVDLGTGTPQPAFAHNGPQPIGRALQFTNATPGLRALHFSWDFGDGAPQVTDASPAHVYTAVGSYTVTLRATTPWGATAVRSAVVQVAPARQFVPIAVARP